MEKLNQLDKLVEYIRKYPEFISEIMALHQCYDLSKLREFFKRLDLASPYIEHPKHKGYLKYKKDINRLITGPKAYSIKFNLIDQDYTDDKHTKKIYDKVSRTYGGVVNKFWPFGRDEAMKWLNPMPNEKILEVGIGPGLNFKYYPEHCDITGIDFSEGMINVAKIEISKLNKKNINIFRMDIHKTTFPDNSFDKVYSFYAISTVRNPLKALKEIKRVLKSGGIAIIFEPIKSKIEEVAMLQYLFQPVGRQMGHVWIDNFPPYTIPYNSFLDIYSILDKIEFELESDKSFDPPYEIVHLIKCRKK